MNILFINCTADLYGASRMMLRTAEQQVKDGHHVTVVLPYDGVLRLELEKVGIHVRIIPFEPTLRKRIFRSPVKFVKLCIDCFRATIAYSRLIRTEHIQIVHSNSSQIIAGGLAAKISHVPHIFHIRESYSGFGFFWNLYQKFLLSFSECVVCVSKAMAQQFPSYESDKRINVVHDGFPVEEFDRVPKDNILKFKNSFNLNGYFLVGLVGRIILQRKGQDVFVRAVSLMKDRYPKVGFLIIGGCYPGNEYHLQNLNQLIEELQVENAVILTGEIEDIKPVYAALDISIMASATAEPFGGVTIESMAFGKPVVGTNIGGTPEQIDDGKTGILIPPNDPEAMAAAIAEIIDDRRLRIQMGKSARKMFINRFGFNQYYSDLMNLYQLLTSDQ